VEGGGFTETGGFGRVEWIEEGRAEDRGGLGEAGGIEGQDSDEGQISWPESDGEETEVQEGTGKGKQKQERSDGQDEENEMGEQEEGDEMEGVEEGGGSFSPVAFSVGTGV